MIAERVGWRPPQFFTKAWVSTAAQDYWDPIFKRTTDFWNDLEVWSVVAETRPCGLPAVPPSDLPQFCQIVKNRSLYYQPVGYDNGLFRVVVSHDEELILDFYKAWTSRNEPEIARLLGYPECCAEWFAELWKSGKRDTCLAMDTGSPYNPRCNIMLRDIGVRPVFHLPCSFHCERTIDIASELMQVAYDKGYHKEIRTVYDILEWPILYTSLHGIAEITTPVVKIRRDTDPENEKQTVIYHGEKYPQYGASGLTFPFRKQRTAQLNFVKNNWTDNGFTTGMAMEQGHGWLMSILRGFELDRAREFRVVDFGCGNGELLRRIKEVYPNAIPYGFDLSPDKVERARGILPSAIVQVGDVTGLAFDQMPTFDVGLISLHRIEEANRSGNERFLENLEKCCLRLVIYNYDEWKAQVKIA